MLVDKSLGVVCRGEDGGDFCPSHDDFGYRLDVYLIKSPRDFETMSGSLSRFAGFSFC